MATMTIKGKTMRSVDVDWKEFYYTNCPLISAKVSFDVLSVLGVNGVFIFTGIPGVLAPIEIDAVRIMRNLVLNYQVICGTVNAGRAAFEEGVQDLLSFSKRFPAAVRALITARVALADARDAVLSRGGIKSVVEVA